MTTDSKVTAESTESTASGTATTVSAPQNGRCLKLQFQLPYMTRWGQHLRLIGDGALLGNWDALKGTQMTCRHVGDELYWEATVLMPLAGSLIYKYVVVDEGGRTVAEDAEERLLDVSEQLSEASTILIRDSWQDASNPNLLLSRSAFSEVILAQKSRIFDGAASRLAPRRGHVILRLQCWSWLLQDGDDIIVTGSLPSLGAGQPDKAPAMTETSTPHWQLEVMIPVEAFPIVYKYAVRNSHGDVELEMGQQRTAELDPGPEHKGGPPAVLVKSDGPLGAGRPWRGAGVAVPVFSLRSHSSVGVGEFVDIRALVDLCAATGLRLIQLLPINDTTVYDMWWDSYPYNSVSVFALHPLYLSLDALSDDIPRGVKERITVARRDLDLSEVDYEATLAAKLSIARELFDQKDHALLETKGYRAWFAANEHWLRPYAVFGFLRSLFGTAEHWRWGALGSPTPEILERLAHPSQPFHRSLQFVFYVQYQLHRQLLAVSNYAEANRIALKGDLPIGVAKSSVDTWLSPREFHMDFSTGAPPDYFDPNGQNWGFPTYNWEEMQLDDYSWWRSRLTHMAQYFHAYRIDHILGFFRIWEIPGDCVTGLLGHFRPCIPESRASLEAAGLWDIGRYCLPWITPAILEDTLGELAVEAASKYLREHLPGRFIFRESFDSEAKLAGISARTGSPKWLVTETERMRAGLMKLRHNVLLLRDAGSPDAFTPRIGLMETSSFKELEPAWQGHLRWLHDDYFYRRHSELWSRRALESLPPLMRATDMLVCGEDLGMVPDCVHPVLRRLGLLGLRIQRMPSGEGETFGNPANYPYLTVASPSCHDTSTTRAWFEEDAERRHRFFYEALKLQGAVPEHCTPAVMAAIVKQHLDAPSMWAIFPLQDLMALSAGCSRRPAAEETINDPTNPRHYWRFRIHVGLEELLADAKLLGDVQTLLLASGRTSEDELPSYHAAGNHTS